MVGDSGVQQRRPEDIVVFFLSSRCRKPHHSGRPHDCTAMDISVTQQSCQRRAQGLGNRDRTVVTSVDEDMYEAPGGTGRVFTRFENRQFVLHRTVAELVDHQADLDPFGKGDSRKVVTGGADHVGSHRTVMNVQPPLLDQPGVQTR